MGLIIAVLILFVMLQGFLPGMYANIIGVTLCVSLGGVAFAMWLIEWVLSLPEGSLKAIEIATAIREGADGFLRCDYRRQHPCPLRQSCFLCLRPATARLAASWLTLPAHAEHSTP